MKPALPIDRPTLIWGLLMLATALSWTLGRGPLASDAFAAAGVIAIAFLKARWIGLDFMELRTAPTALRLGFEAWILTTCTILIVMRLP